MTLRAAVIGVGMMGRNHARVYSELSGVQLVAVADANAATAERVASTYGIRARTDYRQLLEEDAPDLISLAVPTMEHIGVALEAIRRGVHLLIEKPIAFTVEEGRRIIKAADEADVKLMVGHIERFNPAVIALKERLQAGELGRVFQMDARRQGPFPARVRDVGVVIDLAVHDLDVMRYISGGEVVRVFAETERRIHSLYEDLLSGLVRFDNGVVGTLTTNWLTPTKIRELSVTGERGMFRVDYLTQDLYFFENATANGPDWDALSVLRGVSEGRMIRHHVPKREPLLTELESFVACVANRTEPAVTGEDGLRVLAVAQAVAESGREHRVVCLDAE